MCWAICTILIRRKTRCRSTRWKRSTSTCCGRLSLCPRTCASWYDEFAFHKIYHRVNHFCVVELSAFYFDMLKDRLYTYAPNSRARRSAQTAIWRIGEALVRLLAPIMSFTCEEVWQYLPKFRTGWTACIWLCSQRIRYFRGIGFRERSQA